MSTATATAKKPAVTAKALKSSYDAGELARQNREPIDSAPGQEDDPLNLEWRRGWISCRTGECQTQNLLDEIQAAGFNATLAELETLNEDQRIAVLDWLDTVPTSETEDEAGLAWDAFNDRAPGFMSIEEASDGILRQIRINSTGAEQGMEQSTGESGDQTAETRQPETASGEGDSAPTGELTETSAESSPPTPAEATPETCPTPTSELQVKFSRQAEHLQEIEEANSKVKDLNSLVVECEAEVKAAKGRLSEAQSERDAAVRVLSQIIDDSKSGQGKLFPPTEIAAAKGTITTLPGSEVITVTTTLGESAPAQPTEEPIIPLSVLSAKEIKKLVGVDAFNAAKDSIEGPIGLSEKQLEKLEAVCESDTLQGLEKWIAADAWWHQKISGFGEAAVSKVTSTIMAYRRVHPQVSF